MSNPVRSSPPEEKFAFFLIDLLKPVGKAANMLETWTVAKINEHATLTPSLKALVKGVHEKSDFLAKAFFILACLYHVYKNPTTFLLSTALGAIESTVPFPFDLPSLREHDILEFSSIKNPYRAPKIMVGLAAARLAGYPVTVISGLLLGNTVYKVVNNGIRSQIDTAAKFLNGWNPLTHLNFSQSPGPTPSGEGEPTIIAVD